jgi:hypothetical protein
MTAVAGKAKIDETVVRSGSARPGFGQFAG